MEETYSAWQTVSFSANSSMIGVFNGASSTHLIKVYRIFCLNVQTAAITVEVTGLEMWTTTAQTGGSSITPVAHDSDNEALDANVSIAYGATVTRDQRLRRWPWYVDEFAAGGVAASAWEVIPALNIVWDLGYGVRYVDPILLRPNEGIDIWHLGTTTVGSADLMIQFSQVAA